QLLQMKLPRWSSYFLAFYLPPLVQAYTVFETNCSAPVITSNYVSSPNTRGTLDILWSSLFTIFACTWTLQHPNVPKQRDEDTKWKNVKWGLKKFGRSTLRMLSTILAPELIIAAACDDFIAARENLKKMKKYAKRDKVPWTLRHSYYANMGGAEAASQGSAPLGPYLNPYHLTGANIITLRRNGYISKLPYIKEAEIKDRSKGDVLVKIIALGQIVWSIFQIVVRAVRRLPVSPLDVAVAAYAVCAVIIYFIYWGKPQRVDYAHTIQLDPMTHEILQLIKFNGNRRIFREEMKELLKLQPAPMGAPISMDSSKRPWYKMRVPAFAALGAVQFGGIHAIAWNFAFPSTFELIFWRCASIYMTAAPLCAWLLF
ncbi:uncharacterized protein TRIVIDRAFT_14128, partial [Trichoderma virens Gv29-8]